MYTLLIADDEQLERDAIELLVSRSGLPVQCIKAKNGREAVELTRKHSPEIVFLDIQMPGMNGLEAGRRIKEISPECQLAFLTAWGNFDFAQEAIRLGACDYLVKPSADTAVYELLDKCIRNIQRRRAPDDAFKKVINLFTREFFASLKFGNLSEDAVRSYLRLQGIETEQGVALVVGGMAESQLVDLFEKDSELSRSSVCYFASPDRITVLAFTDRQQQLVGRLDHALPVFAGSGKAVGVGMFFDSLEGIPQSIHTASVAYTSAMHNGWNLLRFSDIGKTENGEDVAVAQRRLVQMMHEAVLEGNQEKARQLAHELVDGILAHYSDTRRAELEFYELILVFCYGIGGSIPHFYRDRPTRGSMSELETYLMDFIDAACDAILLDRQDKYARSFALVDRYLHSHYAEPLSAEDIADFVQINRSYFSKLFKEYFDMPFVEYVTEIRMKKASALLQEGKSVKDTASLTGFSDHNYFSRVFRQYYGTSPTSFKSGRS
jgi:two-component system response regulator YesN